MCIRSGLKIFSIKKQQMDKQEIAILFSGGRDSLALYALGFSGRHPEFPRCRRIHLLHMLNGMSRFHTFPEQRFQTARAILERQVPVSANIPESLYLELDCGRLWQGLWLDRYEALMPMFGGKNLVCVACKLAMHVRAILYCVRHLVPQLYAGYTLKQAVYPEQRPVFMDRVAGLSEDFGIKTLFPLYNEFQAEETARHFLEDAGLPSTGGGERKCLFCQTLSTAGEDDIAAYMDHMIPQLVNYMELKISGNIRDAAACFPPGNSGDNAGTSEDSVSA